MDNVTIKKNSIDDSYTINHLGEGDVVWVARLGGHIYGGRSANVFSLTKKQRDSMINHQLDFMKVEIKKVINTIP